MPLYWADFLADTLHLNRAEIGSYMLLIGAYWRKGSALSDDDEYLRNICRCPGAEWVRCKGTLAAFFKVGDGVWLHKRIEQELSDANSEYAAQLSRTKAATEARRKAQEERDRQRNEQRDVDATENVGDVVTKSQPQPQPQPQPQSPTGMGKPPLKKLSVSERISSEKELGRVAKELNGRKPTDASGPNSRKRIEALIARQSELRNKLEVTA